MKFKPLIRQTILEEDLLRPLVFHYQVVEFTPELIYLLVEGRLKRAYERNFR